MALEVVSLAGLAPGEVVLHEGMTLVETDDPLLLVELLAEPRLRAAVELQLSPCAALVRPGAGASFLQELMKAGHTPKVSDL